MKDDLLTAKTKIKELLEQVDELSTTKKHAMGKNEQILKHAKELQEKVEREGAQSKADVTAANAKADAYRQRAAEAEKLQRKREQELNKKETEIETLRGNISQKE